MRLIPMLCLLAALASWAPSPARGAGVPIEGKLLVEYWDRSSFRHAYFMEGTSENKVPVPWAVDLPDVSPDTAKVAYSVLIASQPYPEAADIWVANLDGSGAANLTGAAGLGGVNCNPTWSPDGRMIAFQHSAPAVGQPRCGSGFQVWLMAAEGTGLHQWIPSATFLTMSASWAPDGYHIACESSGRSCLTADATGGNVRALPGVDGRDVEWSRDGSRIVYTTMLPDTVSGEPGVWDQLCLANSDGSNVQVLVEQFLKDSDLAAHIAKYNFPPTDPDWAARIRWWAGPRKSKWSPLGDRIAFAAALPFDPDGPEFWYQIEVWLYDLKTGQTTRLTSDTVWDDWLSWAGPNTSAVSPQVKVNNTSVTFSHVNQEGWTSIIRREDLPPLPVPYLRVGNFYEIRTTAQVSGPAAVAMSYAEGDVASAAEGHLAILYYDQGQGQWKSVTVSRDPAKNEVRGQLSELGLAGLALPLPTSHFTDVPSSWLDPYWALWEIEACVAADIVSGYLDGTYHPEYPVTRDQMAAYISRALAGGEENVPPKSAYPVPSFTDVLADQWAYNYIEYAVSQNVVKGYEDGSYQPGAVVDRGQMAVFVAQGMVAPGGDAAIPDPTGEPSFSDVPSSFWSYNQVEYIAAEGVVKGYEDGLYHPERTCTRDQMAVYVAKAFDLPL